jgi:cytochrome c-type biogenesis protein CcmH
MRKTRLLQLVLVAALACTALGASDRFNDLGHKIMCPCGCDEILVECNHVGCPDSTRMIGELHSQLDAGVGDRPILNWFMDKYGPTVLAAPMRGGWFDGMAWVTPFAVFAFAILGAAFMVRRWRRPVPSPTRAMNAKADPLRDRIRKETEY